MSNEWSEAELNRLAQLSDCLNQIAAAVLVRIESGKVVETDEVVNPLEQQLGMLSSVVDDMLEHKDLRLEHIRSIARSEDSKRKSGKKPILSLVVSNP